MGTKATEIYILLAGTLNLPFFKIETRKRHRETITRVKVRMVLLDNTEKCAEGIKKKGRRKTKSSIKKVGRFSNLKIDLIPNPPLFISSIFFIKINDLIHTII